MPLSNGGSGALGRRPDGTAATVILYGNDGSSPPYGARTRSIVISVRVSAPPPPRVHDRLAAKFDGVNTPPRFFAASLARTGARRRDRRTCLLDRELAKVADPRAQARCLRRQTPTCVAVRIIANGSW